MSHWAPTTRHYAVDGGHLAVTVNTFLTATGVDIFYCDETGGPISMTPVAQFADGTNHTAALELLGYTVVDEIGDESATVVGEQVAAQEQSVVDMLPPEIAAMIAASQSTTEEYTA